MRPLTDRQREILRFIVTYQRREGFPPTIREIAAGAVARLGTGAPNATGRPMSNNGVNDHLVALEKKGFLFRRVFARSRGIQITLKAAEAFPELQATPPAPIEDELREILNRIDVVVWRRAAEPGTFVARQCAVCGAAVAVRA